MRILNCRPSQGTEKDWTLGGVQSAGLQAKRTTLPASVDLREDWWQVGDQGSTGSCVGWACADSVVRWHVVKAGKVAVDELLSVRYVWMAAKESDEFTGRPSSFIEEEGTSLKAALDVCRKYGMVLDADLPFGGGKLYRGSLESFYIKAAGYKIASYYNLRGSLNDWRRWLAEHGPILTRLNVDETWENASDTDGTLDFYFPESARGGHAVAIVGYTADRFIVRNSWGEDWGDKGFAYASTQYAQAAFDEVYGVML